MSVFDAINLGAFMASISNGFQGLVGPAAAPPAPVAQATSTIRGVRVVAATQAELDNVQRAFDRLAQSPLGERIIQRLATVNATLTLHDPKEWASGMFAQSGGITSPLDGTIHVPASYFESADTGAQMIAHEGSHAADFVDNQGLFGTVRDGLGAAILGASNGVYNIVTGAAAHDPIRDVMQSVHEAMWTTETRAYHYEAIVSKDLGLADWGFGTNPDGSLASDDQIHERLRTSSLYSSYTA